MVRIVLILTLFIFSPAASFADDFLNVNFDAPPMVNNTPKKENIFSKIFKKINKKPAQKKQKAQFDLIGGGYTGNLPDINSEFEYKKDKTSSASGLKKNAEQMTPEDFQESKIDDPLFLDVILNKEKPSKYTTDMLRIMKFLESFRVVIENHEPVQKFNAHVNMLNLYTKNIEKNYSQTPEGMSPSYLYLADLNYKAKILGNLKFDANYYSKFSPITGTQYDPEYLINEDKKLLSDLDKTVFAIRQLNN